jgi:hypothetical protein
VTFLFAVVDAWAVAALVDPNGLVVTWLVIEFGKGEEGEGRVWMMLRFIVMSGI